MASPYQVVVRPLPKRRRVSSGKGSGQGVLRRTDALDAIVATDLRAGEVMKFRATAAGGAGNSTAFREYARAHPDGVGVSPGGDNDHRLCVARLHAIAKAGVVGDLCMHRGDCPLLRARARALRQPPSISLASRASREVYGVTTRPTIAAYAVARLQAIA